MPEQEGAIHHAQGNVHGFVDSVLGTTAQFIADAFLPLYVTLRQIGSPGYASGSNPWVYRLPGTCRLTFYHSM